MKTETTFTPGSLVNTSFETSKRVVTIRERASDGPWIADCVDYYGNLFQAAPDMFEALEMIATDLENGVGNPRTMAELARAVLAKAAGRERGTGK